LERHHYQGRKTLRLAEGHYDPLAPYLVTEGELTLEGLLRLSA
jgi:hypothetical protein